MKVNLRYFGGRGAGMNLGSEGPRTSGTAHPIDLNKIKDKSLEGVERRIRNLKHEELFVFDENDNLIAGYRGNATSVAFPAEYLSMEGATVTHGHPKGMEEFGGTFSFADMHNMLSSNWAEHRATASGQGEMNYILRRGKNADASGFDRELSRNEDRLQKNFENTYNRTYQEEIEKGTSEKQAVHVARQKGVGILNAWYKETAPKYGYEYITRKNDYKYNR